MAINWNGTFSTALDEIVKSSDEAFAEHFSTLLNPSTPTTRQHMPNSGIYIPVLDDPIDPIEVEKSIKRLKPNKAAGLDGVAPDLLKLLNDEWLIAITHLFQEVFTSQ